MVRCSCVMEFLEEVGPTRRVENLALAPNAVEISAGGRVVMPGFVDSHTHLLFPSAGRLADPSDIEVRAGAGSLRSTNWNTPRKPRLAPISRPWRATEPRPWKEDGVQSRPLGRNEDPACAGIS